MDVMNKTTKKAIALFLFIFTLSLWATVTIAGSTKPVRASFEIKLPASIIPTPTEIPCPKVVLLREEIKQYIRCKNWSGKTKEALAVARAESGYNPENRNLNKGHSLDRGIFMINDYYHSEVSMLCSFEAKCNIDAANRIFHANGDSFAGQWAAWNNGSYLQFMETEQK
jgi:hypothetical protein